MSRSLPTRQSRRHWKYSRTGPSWRYWSVLQSHSFGRDGWVGCCSKRQWLCFRARPAAPLRKYPQVGRRASFAQPISAITSVATEQPLLLNPGDALGCSVEFIAEHGGRAGVRLRKGELTADKRGATIPVLRGAYGARDHGRGSHRCHVADVRIERSAKRASAANRVCRRVASPRVASIGALLGSNSDNTPNSHLLIADCNTGRTEYRPAAIPLSASRDDVQRDGERSTITRSPRSAGGPTHASLGELFGARSSRVHSTQYPDAL
jgi:hypothetical protein